MKKQLLRVKQLADQAIYRSEKSEIVTEDLAETERRVENLRSICHNVRRRLADSVTSTKSDDPTKRLKKTPCHQMGMAMKEGCTLLGSETLIGRVLDECGTLHTRLAQERLSVEQLLEETVLENSILPQLLDTDIPQVQKLRKHLNRLTLDTDALRNRLQSSQRMSSISSSFTNHNHTQAQHQQKMDSVRDELDSTQAKLDQQKDTWAGDMFAVMSRESDLAHLFFYQLRLQLEYHRGCLKLLEERLPQLEHSINSASTKPVYGLSLEEHLRVSDRQVALPIQLCVCRLIQLGTDVEGLFRMAGSASKVRKLKSCLDAGRWNDASFISCTDAHAVADTLKSYLRTLPEPLMYSQLFDEWMAVAQLKDEETKVMNIESILKQLPQPYYINLRFLIKFMAHLCKDCTVTKMTAYNLSIVIAPNLLWKGEAAMTITTTSTQTLVVELLIKHCHRLFPQDVDFFEGLEDVVSLGDSNVSPPYGADSDDCLSTSSGSKLSGAGTDYFSSVTPSSCSTPAVSQSATTPLHRRVGNGSSADTNLESSKLSSIRNTYDTNNESLDYQPSTLRRRKKQTAPIPPAQPRFPTMINSSNLPPPPAPPRPPAPALSPPGSTECTAAPDAVHTDDYDVATRADSAGDEEGKLDPDSSPVAGADSANVYSVDGVASSNQNSAIERPVPVPLPRVQVHVRSNTQTVSQPSEPSALERQMSLRRPKPRVDIGRSDSANPSPATTKPARPAKPIFQDHEVANVPKEESEVIADDDVFTAPKRHASVHIRPKPSFRARPEKLASPLIAGDKREGSDQVRPRPSFRGRPSRPVSPPVVSVKMSETVGSLIDADNTSTENR